MPFDDTPHENGGGGGGDDRHEHVDAVAISVVRSIPAVAAAAGVCTACLAETIALVLLARCAKSLQKAYGDEAATEMIVSVSKSIAAAVDIELTIDEQKDENTT